MHRLLYIYYLFIVVRAFRGFEKSDDGGDDGNLDRKRVTQEAEIIDSLLDGYNPEVRPIGKVFYEAYHRPVVVIVNMYIRSMQRVDDAKMQYDLQVTFRQKWNDDRLAYVKEGPDSVTLKDHHKIWTPDTFFANENEGHRHMLEQPNTLVRIKRDGSVFYSTRLSLSLFCPMEFSKFPFDNQTCTLTIESYAHTEDDIVYAWDNDTPIKYATDYTKPLIFTVTNISYSGGSSFVKGHVYSFIKVAFHLQREFGYYLYHYYIPVVMLVVISWLPLFLHPSKATARVCIALGSLALLTLLVFLINKDIPKTSYTKAIDVWNGVALTFVFFSLTETVLVSHLHSVQLEYCGANTPEPQEVQLITPASKWSARRRQRSIVGRIRALFKGRAERVDRTSRVLFPVAFAVFVLLYFIFYWL